MYMEARKLTFNSEGGISNYAKPINFIQKTGQY